MSVPADLDFDDAPAPAAPTDARRFTRADRSLDPREEVAQLATHYPPSRFVGRELPNNIEAEESLLSCCLLDGADVIRQCVQARVSTESFYDPKHAIIFGALLGLFISNRKIIDVAVLAAELKTTKQLDKVGGIPFLMQVSSRIPTTAQAGFFIDKVRENAVLRRVIRESNRTIEECYNYTGGIDDFAHSVSSRIASAVMDRSCASEWKILSAAQLCSEPPEAPAEIIIGLLYSGGTMMLSGPSKAHKTYTMLAAGIAIATGRDWLGFRTVPCPVLYLNLELQDFALETRVRAITTALGVAVPSELHVANLRGVMVSLDLLEERVGPLIEKIGAKLVIVDPHYKISAASGVEENSNDDQAAFLYRIETLCAKSGAGVMIAHHFSKGNASAKNAIDRAAGGGALARWPDVVMTLTEHDEAGCMSIEFALRNFAPVPPFVVRWDHPIWKTAADLNPTKLKNIGGRVDEHPPEKALQALGKEQLTRAEWRKLLGWEDRTLRRKIDKLLADKKVKEVCPGVYSARAPDDISEPLPHIGATREATNTDLLKRLKVAFSSKYLGREKRCGFGELHRAANAVETMTAAAFKPVLNQCLEVGILNSDKEDSRYFVP